MTWCAKLASTSLDLNLGHKTRHQIMARFIRPIWLTTMSHNLSLFVVTAASVLVLLLVGNGPGNIPELLLDIGFGGGGPLLLVDAALDQDVFTQMMKPDFLKAVKTKKSKFEQLHNLFRVNIQQSQILCLNQKNADK